VKTGDICERHAKKSVQLTVRLLQPESADEDSMVLIEGRKEALHMLAELLVAACEEGNDGFFMSPTGPGSLHFSTAATLGIYLHCLGSEGSEPNGRTAFPSKSGGNCVPPSNIILVGDPASFAIETGIAEAVERDSQLALGYHVVHVGGFRFGVKAADATMLGCSYGAIVDRVRQRGQHVADFSQEAAREIAWAHIATTYREPVPGASFFGFTGDAINQQFWSRHLVWAPDGDEAFDDGSFVLQFDLDDRVRLIAFREDNDYIDPMVDRWMSADLFYGLLATWVQQFDALREALLNQQRSNPPPSAT
jgi:hypothetical protein